MDSDKDENVPDLEDERAENALDEHSQSDSSEPTRKQTKHNSTHHNAKPTQLQFYPGIWADILEQAKQYFQLWLIKKCPFLECNTHLKNAGNALLKAIKEFEDNNCEVEEGKCK